MSQPKECKKCMICSLIKPIRKEDDPVKTMNDDQIHEYNYICYTCLDKLEKERQLNTLLKKLDFFDFA